MKNILTAVKYTICFFWFTTSFGQSTISVCNDFENPTQYIYLDTNSVWEIGQPNKTSFDSSYSVTNSIITDTVLNYSNNDTSIFYAIYKKTFGGIPQYLSIFLPLVIEFDHRFMTDSTTDFGNIEFSIDNGTSWTNVLNNEYNISQQSGDNSHYYENSGITQYDSLIVSENSDGWIHSRFSKNIELVIQEAGFPNVDSVVVKFSFISDSIGGNEGWQIDNLCISMDQLNGIEKQFKNNQIIVTPNPNEGEFKLSSKFSSPGNLRIFDSKGKVIFEKKGIFHEVNLNLDLSPGIYLVKIETQSEVLNSKLVIE
jgi:hypothetical protein